MGCHLTHEARAQKALDDVASTIRQSVPPSLLVTVTLTSNEAPVPGFWLHVIFVSNSTTTSLQTRDSGPTETKTFAWYPGGPKPEPVLRD